MALKWPYLSVLLGKRRYLTIVRRYPFAHASVPSFINGLTDLTSSELIVFRTHCTLLLSWWLLLVFAFNNLILSSLQRYRHGVTDSPSIHFSKNSAHLCFFRVPFNFLQDSHTPGGNIVILAVAAGPLWQQRIPSLHLNINNIVLECFLSSNEWYANLLSLFLVITFRIFVKNTSSITSKVYNCNTKITVVVFA